MIYSIAVTTPKNTPESAPLRTELPLEVGIIHKVELDFPSGNQFLHRVQMHRYGSYIFPKNAQGLFTADGFVISFRENVEITDDPRGIWIHSWNLDEDNDHTVLVRIGILPKAILTPWLLTWQEKVAATDL